SCSSSKSDITMNDQQFPELKAQLLSGEKVTFPEVANGAVTMVTLVFEKGAKYMKPQLQSNNWQAFWEEELKEQGVNFYEIPMMGGGYRLARSWIDSGMRSGIPAELHANVACFYGDKMKYAELLEIDDITECYVCMIDEEGNLLASHQGEISPESKAEFLGFIVNP
ncbi:MAG: hypothetical protein AAFN81_28130, partial [Bacteroidota bacterium]